MSVINATIAAGTRRMLQDVLAWNNARSHDITRVNAMVASGLVPKDDSGNPKLPAELLDALWRPFPGSQPSVVNVSSIADQQSAGSESAPQAAPAIAAAPAVTQSTSGISWPKAAALAAALLGGAGGLGSLGYWLGSGKAPQADQAQPESPSYVVPQTQYELRIGKRQPPQAETNQ